MHVVAMQIVCVAVVKNRDEKKINCETEKRLSKIEKINGATNCVVAQNK